MKIFQRSCANRVSFPLASAKVEQFFILAKDLKEKNMILGKISCFSPVKRLEMLQAYSKNRALEILQHELSSMRGQKNFCEAII